VWGLLRPAENNFMNGTDYSLCLTHTQTWSSWVLFKRQWIIDCPACSLLNRSGASKRKSKLVSSWRSEWEKERKKEDTMRGGHCKEKDNYSQEEVVQNCTALGSLIGLKKYSYSIFAYTIKSIQWVCSAVHTNNINYSHRWEFKDLDL